MPSAYIQNQFHTFVFIILKPRKKRDSFKKKNCVVCVLMRHPCTPTSNLVPSKFIHIETLDLTISLQAWYFSQNKINSQICISSANSIWKNHI